MAKDFIVAIEIGSSKITGIAGKKNSDGSVSILALAKETPSSCVKKGVVYNLDRTVQCLSSIITKLKTALKTEIAYAYVGVGGQSTRSVRNVIIKELPADSIVSQDMVDSLMDANRSMLYPDTEIIEAITHEYKLDQQFQLDPVGVQCTHLEGHFLNILWRNNNYRNLKKCFSTAGIAIADVFISPMALADSVLTDSEKRSGCVLVDLGAQTTTVAVYSKNLLRHLAVIPLGSANITKDLTTLQMEEEDAERIKLKYASAYTDPEEDCTGLSYTIDEARTIQSETLINVVEARIEEIIGNVKFQIPEIYDGKLLAGLILTGGGAQLNNIEEAFRRKTSFTKIRTAKFVNHDIHSKHPEITAQDGSMNTLLGLLLKGNLNCAGREISDNLFADDEERHTALPSEDAHKQEVRHTDNTLHVPTNEPKTEPKHIEGSKHEEHTEENSKETSDTPTRIKNWKNKISSFIKQMTEEE